MRSFMCLCAIAALALACSDSDSTSDDDSASSANTGGASSGNGGGGMGGGGGTAATGGSLPFVLTSTAFEEGGTWPTEHECGPPYVADGPGDNISPQLSWTPGPDGTQSYAVVMRDLDAGGLIHWVIYDIPATATGLPEGIPEGHMVTDPAGAKQAEIQNVVHVYFGPCSPNSINTYELTVHALDTATLPGATDASQESELAPQVESMSIGSASLSGES